MFEDKSLIRQVKLGRKEALRQIYEKYKDDLLTIAESMLNETGAAEDILHDVFVSFAGSVKDLYFYGSLRNYLITCTINRVRSRFHRKMYQVIEIDRARPLRSVSEDLKETTITAEKSNLLTKALAELPFEQREVVVLRLQAQMGFREIGHMQNVSVNTARVRYHYGLAKLRKLVNQEADI